MKEVPFPVFLALGDHPEDWFGPVQAGQGFEVDLVPILAHPGQEEAEQGRVVEPPQDTLPHLAAQDTVGLGGRLGLGVPLPAEIGTFPVMNPARTGVHLAVKRLF